MVAAAAAVQIRVIAFCLMKNHWHLVLWPVHGVDLSAYMQKLMNRHIRQYLRDYSLVGTGHVYQGRYKAFPIQGDAHLLNVLRYVEANPQRAGLVARAEDWPWSSLATQTHRGTPLLTPSPVPRPANWLQLVNLRAAGGELLRLRYSVQRGAPFGNEEWVMSMAERHNLQSAIRNPGPPGRRSASGDSHRFGSVVVPGSPLRETVAVPVTATRSIAAGRASRRPGRSSSGSH